MSKETHESVSERKGRRTLLKGAMFVLGAGAILQPAGAVFGLNAQETPKKDDTVVHRAAKPGTKKTSGLPVKSKSHKKGKTKQETPKKDGI